MNKSDAKKLCAGLAVLFALAGRVPADGSVKLPPITAGVMLPDGQTLVVSVPSKGLLIYLDTTAEKETKRIDVDFQPMCLAAQGKNLFVSAKGSGMVHVLEAESGKDLKTIKVPGEPISALGCHPAKGLLYSVNQNNEVYAIDTDAGEATKTAAKGQLLAVDPTDDGFVYTGIQKPIQDQLVVKEGRGKQVIVSLEHANLRAVAAKFKPDGKDLKLVAANDNAAVNGNSMAVSRDGKAIAMAGGGGWQSKTDTKANYAVAVFDTSDLTTLLGQVDTGPYPQGIAFHPVLDLGAAFHSGITTEIAVFKSKSCVVKDTITIQKQGIPPLLGPSLLIFGGRGTKIVFATLAQPLPFPVPGADQSEVSFYPLTLSDADKEALNKAYSR